MKNSIADNRMSRRLLTHLFLSLIVVMDLCSVAAFSSTRQDPAGKQKPGENQTAAEAAGIRPGDRELQGGNKITRDGVTIEMSVGPASSRKEQLPELVGGDDVSLSFKITDAVTGNPLTGVHPAAWMDLRENRQTTGKDCREKVQAFLQGSLAARPAVDLNSYYVLAMNREATISVIDPLLGYGTTKLLTLIFLNNPGEDWTQSKDGKRIYVTMPASNQVAVVDTVSFKVTANITTGLKPSRIALQNDQRYVWVGCAGLREAGHAAGVSVIDTTTNAVASSIQTGPGNHDIVFSADDRFAFVTNSADGTVSVIDVPTLTLVKNLKIGNTAASIAYSNLSNSVYVSDETSGVVTVIDARLHEVVSTIKFAPGIGAVRFAPNGRVGVVLNSRANTASAFDAATNRLIQRFEVEPGPDQVSFTAGYAYIRSMRSDHVSMIPIAGLEKTASVEVARIPGGQASPERSGLSGLAHAIVPAPEGGAVLIANPTDKMIYYYSEGMAAPMGSFQNYKREPLAISVVDRSLRQSAPGVYSVMVRLPEAGGDYDVPFLLDSPRVVYCFSLNVKPNPEFAKKQSAYPLKVNYLIEDTRIPVGQKVKFRFKLSDPVTRQPRADLKDVDVLTLLAPGVWHERTLADHTADGIYEISFVPPEHGVYYVFIECPSLKVKLNELPYMILDGREQGEQKPTEKALSKPADKP
ncbi:MAG TPA: cytochrome D1 domain-containing protein [Blastocatellia bacterium]|nr:cytochrome D1 domain-containing protein [Blastocatellia bacterium]